jgi:hypothetical protein
MSKAKEQINIPVLVIGFFGWLLMMLIVVNNIQCIDSTYEQCDKGDLMLVAFISLGFAFMVFYIATANIGKKK